MRLVLMAVLGAMTWFESGYAAAAGGGARMVSLERGSSTGRIEGASERIVHPWLEDLRLGDYSMAGGDIVRGLALDGEILGIVIRCSAISYLYTHAPDALGCHIITRPELGLLLKSAVAQLGPEIKAKSSANPVEEIFNTLIYKIETSYGVDEFSGESAVSQFRSELLNCIAMAYYGERSCASASSEASPTGKYCGLKRIGSEGETDATMIGKSPPAE